MAQAQWAPSTYTISYNANGGTGTMADTLVYKGVPCLFRVNSFTRSGYTCDGWTVKRKTSAGTWEWWFINSAGTTQWAATTPSGYSKRVLPTTYNAGGLTSVANGEVQAYANWVKN